MPIYVSKGFSFSTYLSIYLSIDFPLVALITFGLKYPSFIFFRVRRALGASSGSRVGAKVFCGVSVFSWTVGFSGRLSGSS